MKTYYRYPMKALENCRDLGGLPTEDGGVTRFGVLIRSAAPVDLPPEDIHMFRELNITTSIDLRGGGEVITKPSVFRNSGWVRYIHIDVLSRQAALSSGSEQKKPEHRSDVSGMFTMDWREGYCHMLAGRPAWVYQICEAVADAPAGVHFHCAAGKDRTGLFAMLILAACGVSDEDIAANYCLSEAYLRRFYIGMLENMQTTEYGVEDLNRGFFSTSHTIMRYVLDYLRREYGSTVNYLLCTGVTDEMIAKIREKLVEY